MKKLINSDISSESKMQNCFCRGFKFVLLLYTLYALIIFFNLIVFLLFRRPISFTERIFIEFLNSRDLFILITLGILFLTIIFSIFKHLPKKMIFLPLIIGAILMSLGKIVEDIIPITKDIY